MPKKKEITDWKKEIVKVMSTHRGPWTKKMIRLEIEKKYDYAWTLIYLNISGVLQGDKRSKKPVFHRIRQGWWILAKQKSRR